ncbi:hypothetical protein, partial [Lachnotalea glycerini]
PNTASFSDAQSKLDYTNNDSNSFATLSYTYGDRNIGSTTIDLSNINLSEFNFSSSNSTSNNNSTMSTNSMKKSINSRNIILIVILVVMIIVIIGAGSLFLFKNYHFFKRKRIRKHRKMNRHFDDFNFKE